MELSKEDHQFFGGLTVYFYVETANGKKRTSTKLTQVDQEYISLILKLDTYKRTPDFINCIREYAVNKLNNLEHQHQPLEQLRMQIMREIKKQIEDLSQI